MVAYFLSNFIRLLIRMKYLVQILFLIILAYCHAEDEDAPQCEAHSVYADIANNGPHLHSDNICYPHHDMRKVGYYPMEGIFKVATFIKGRWSACTAFNFGWGPEFEGWVLTAGHCAYDPETKQGAKAFTILPKWPSVGPADIIMAKRMFTFTPYYDSGDELWDVGIIKMERSPGPVRINHTTEWVEKDFKMGGWPLVLPQKCMRRPDYPCYCTGTPYLRENEDTIHHIEHRMDSTAGMSGGPMVHPNRKFVGVHSKGNCTAAHETWNRAVHISGDTFDLLNKLLQALYNPDGMEVIWEGKKIDEFRDISQNLVKDVTELACQALPDEEEEEEDLEEGEEEEGEEED